MGSRISRNELRCLVIPDTRISPSTLTDIGAGGASSADSSYTQAGARAGVPVAGGSVAAVLEATGSQTDQGILDVVTLRAGMPGPNGAGIVVRDAAVTVEWMGWEGFQSLSGREVLYGGSGSAGGSLPSVLRLSSGYVLMAHQEAGGASGSVAVERYDPTTGTWTSQITNTLVQAQPSQPCVPLLETPAGVWGIVVAAGGRNLHAIRSLNDGYSFSVKAHNVLVEPLPAGATIHEVRAAYSEGEVLLLIRYDSGSAEEVAQYASRNGGITYDLVDATWDIAGDQPQCVDVTALTGGGFLVVYNDDATTNRYRSIRVGSAYESVQAASSVVVMSGGPGGIPSAAVWTDEVGIAYVVLSLDDGSSYKAGLFRSVNSGTTWESYSAPIAELSVGAQDTELNEFACTSVGGLALLVTRFTVPAAAESSSAVLCLYMGGLSTVTVPATAETPDAAAATAYLDTAFVPWGDAYTGGGFGGLYLGIEVPGSSGWTTTGAGGWAINSDLLLSVPSPSPKSASRSKVDAGVTGAIVEFSAKTDTKGTATEEAAVRVVVSDYDGSPASATFTYAISVRFDSDGWAIYDTNAGTIVGSKVGVGMGTGDDEIRIRVVLGSNGYLQSWYAPVSRHETTWEDGPAWPYLTSTPADLPNRVDFGHWATSNDESLWNYLGFSFCGARWSATSTTAATSTFANAYHVGFPDLHALPLSAYPQYIRDGVSVFASAGPAAYLDTWRIQPAYDYPLSAVFPSVDPSPRRGWRSIADGVEQRFTFLLDSDFASARTLSRSLAVALLETNLETATLDTSPDGTTWTTIANWDSTQGWTSLQYDRRGRNLRPSPGGIAHTAATYFRAADHVGDTFDLNLGGSDDLHIIEANAEGAWVIGSTTKLTELRLADTNMPGGLADTGTGTGKVRRRSAVQVVASYNDHDQYVRLRIPAQDTAEGYYRIGTLVIGDVIAFGHQYDRGWSRTYEGNTDLMTRRDGITHSRYRGPAREVWEMAWAETAVSEQEIQQASPDPDWVGMQTGVSLPVATPHDVAHLLRGVQQTQRAGDIPVLFLPRVPVDSSDEQAPRVLLWGRASADVRVEHLLGDEDESEMVRVSTIVLRQEL
jgi:hypothetical protein